MKLRRLARACAGQIVGVATGEPGVWVRVGQPPRVPEPLQCPPGSELAAFVAMLDRAGVYHDHCQGGDGSEVDISPDSEFMFGRSSASLTGAAWGSASFYFDASGTLIRVDISGD